jgi:hypothetical protein
VASTLAATILTGIFLTVLTLPAAARGGHGFGERGMHGAELAGGRRHGNDSYVKAASDEREKLLNTKLKSICRGC